MGGQWSNIGRGWDRENTLTDAFRNLKAQGYVATERGSWDAETYVRVTGGYIGPQWYRAEFGEKEYSVSLVYFGVAAPMGMVSRPIRDIERDKGST